jgi:mannitol-specific phosphotransferase system IIBC component
VQKLDESAEAKLLEKECERKHGYRSSGFAQEVVISCLLAVALMAICFLSAIVILACSGVGRQAEETERPARRDQSKTQGSLSKSTFPPERITPMRLPARSIFFSSRAPMGTAADGSITIFIRSHT